MHSYQLLDRQRTISPRNQAIKRILFLHFRVAPPHIGVSLAKDLKQEQVNPGYLLQLTILRDGVRGGRIACL